MVIGRRGSGKSSLAKYLEFQTRIRNSVSIDVDEPELYEEAFKEIAGTSVPTDMLTRKLVRVWEFVFWNLAFRSCQDHHSDRLSVDDSALLAAAVAFGDHPSKSAKFVVSLLKAILNHITKGASDQLVEHIETTLESATHIEARRIVLQTTHDYPIILAVDTIERYDTSDERLMCITSALIEAASRFSSSYRSSGLHIKVFVASEIAPHLKENSVTNALKYFRNPLYLHWRPKDLVRLICFRLFKHLQRKSLLGFLPSQQLDWNDFTNILTNIWEPVFGKEIVNGRGVIEHSFPYLLRHTQLLPRQLVVLCNAIAKQAIDYGSFPKLRGDKIAEITRETELDLANEVFNSYARIYPNVAIIVDALHGSPMRFHGNHLDSVAKKTSSAWPTGRYDLVSFRRLVAELGIVGKVRDVYTNGKATIVEADFEYTLRTRLPLLESDDCVIHPMFYSRFQTKRDEPLVVYPFPDHPDFQEVYDRESR